MKVDIKYKQINSNITTGFKRALIEKGYIRIYIDNRWYECNGNNIEQIIDIKENNNVIIQWSKSDYPEKIYEYVAVADREDNILEIGNSNNINNVEVLFNGKKLTYNKVI